jgi:hypothetical protein
MKTIYSITFFAAMLCLASCKKDVLLDGNESIQRSNALEKELKAKLHSAPDGWIMFVRTLNPNVITATPIIMKFDTVSSKVSMTSMYGKDAEPSLFSVSATTGMPQLTFSTGSTLSAMYEIGNTNVTDHFFKVLKVGADTIEIQPYRKGQASQSEGGEIFKMVRNTKPAWIADWQKETTKFMTRQDLFGYYLSTSMTYANGQPFTPLRMVFLNQPAGNITFFKENYPTMTNNKQVEAFSFAYYPLTGAAVQPLSFAGYNSIFYESTTGFSPATLFNTGPATIMSLFKTNYFLIRKLNPDYVDVFALDKDGKEVITGRIGFL